MFKKLIISLALVLSGTSVVAQLTLVKASLDSTSILIGHQTKVHLTVVTEKNKQLQLPVFQDTLMKNIEVLEIYKPDTMDIGNSRIQINQDYLITSFDSALYVLPPMQVIDGYDTLYSNSLALKVTTFPVDVESGQFYDIKDVIQPPFVLADYLWIIVLVVIVIALALFLYFFIRMLNKGEGIGYIRRKKAKLPPHIIAVNKLDEIKSEKLWQQGKYKEYHSGVADTVREYIRERFDVPALEMTSGETLEKIRRLNDAESVYDNLKQMLALADFVKFAKYNPIPEENELSLMNAYLFVNQTRVEEEEGNEKNEKNEGNEGNEGNENN